MVGGIGRGGIEVVREGGGKGQEVGGREGWRRCVRGKDREGRKR